MNFKAKGNTLVSVLACNIMMSSFQDEKHWPDTFVKVSKLYLKEQLRFRIIIYDTVSSQHV